jgi:RHS repeat-associated protein
MPQITHPTPAAGLALMALLGVGLALPLQADRLTRYTYNDQGLVETVDGPRREVSDITTYRYDAQGNRTHIRNALGHETRITALDAAGRPLTAVDPNGLTTQLRYDPRGRLLSLARSDGTSTRTTTYAYDPAGNLTAITPPDGTPLGFVYDAANRLIGLRDAHGNRLDYTLDAHGNRLREQVTDAHGVLRRTRWRVYDKLGRLSERSDAQHQTTTFAYDANGNLTRQTDARRNPTGHAYDALDRRVLTRDAHRGLTTFSYDRQDHLLSLTDPNGLTTTYTYDGLGNRLSQASPDTGLTTYTYDAAGNRSSQTDARGVTLTSTYDALNRLTGIHYPDPSLNVSFFYDEGVHGIGRLTHMRDAQGSTTYRYNAFGQLLSVSRTRATLTTVFRYSYDAAGRLARLTYPSGYRILYRYDELGQLSELTLESPDANRQPLASNLHYLPFGPLQALDYGNGLSLQRGFDQDYRLITQDMPGVLHEGYQRDAVGNLTAWADRLDSGRDQGFDYDALNRLIHASGRYGELSFAYDPTGNRTRFTQDRATDTYQYALDSHRLLAILGHQPETRSYDAVGNTLQRGLDRYDYDATNRPVRYTRAGQVAEYAYNGQGERVSKTVNGLTTHFRYSPDGQLLGEYAHDGNPLREYVYLHGEPLALLAFRTARAPGSPRQTHSRHMWQRAKPGREGSDRQQHDPMSLDGSDRGHQGPALNRTPRGAWRGARVERNQMLSKRGRDRAAKPRKGARDNRGQEVEAQQPMLNLSYLHTDHLGAVVKATDAQQNLVWDAVRRPFGARSLITAQITMPLGFPGQYYDEESGTFYNYFRDYDSATGRYLQSDPIGLDGGLNTYAYAGGNPITFIDSLGLAFEGGLQMGIPGFNLPGGVANFEISKAKNLMEATATVGMCTAVCYITGEADQMPLHYMQDQLKKKSKKAAKLGKSKKFFTKLLGPLGTAGAIVECKVECKEQCK